MLLLKVKIKNYRLLVNAELDVDNDITLIVGRNNTAKTSCMDLIEKVLKNGALSFNDYPLSKRKYQHHTEISNAENYTVKISFEEQIATF